MTTTFPINDTIIAAVSQLIDDSKNNGEYREPSHSDIDFYVDRAGLSSVDPKRQVITPIDAPEQFQAEATLARRERKSKQDTPLIRALGLAHYWQRLLDDGKVRTIADIAQMEGINITQVRRLLRLNLLAPKIVENLMNTSVTLLEQVIRHS